MTRRQALRLLGAAAVAVAGVWVLAKIGQILFWIALPVAVVGMGVGLAALHRRLLGPPRPVAKPKAIDTTASVAELYVLDQAGVVDVLPGGPPKP